MSCPKREVSSEDIRKALEGVPGDEASLKAASDNRNVLHAVLNRYAGQFDQDELDNMGLHAVWKALQYHRDEFGQKFTTSLHRFAHWECRCELRRHKKFLNDVRISDDAESPPPLDPAGDAAHLAECLTLLPDHSAKLVREYYVDGMTLVELGKSNGCSKETARQRLGKAVKELRRLCLTA